MAKPTRNKGNRDAQDMLGAILAWPDRLEAGFAPAVSLPDEYRDARQIVVGAMGGSGIGSALAGHLLAGELTVPFTMVRDYDLPAAVGPDTLVVTVSHSGGTEETLSVYRQARERGARVLVVTADGGELAALAAADGVPVIRYDCPGQPRAALPVVLGIWLKLLGELGYVPDRSAAVEGAVSHLAEIVRDVRNTEDNQAHDLAAAMRGRIPIVYGSGFLAEAARRMKGEISENAKQTAAWEVLPEQNHNALVGYEFPAELRDMAVFVLLRSTLEHRRHAARFDFLKGLLDERQLRYVEITGTGPDALSQLVSVVFWGDLASYDLARLNGVDPTPVDVIARLKSALAEEDA